MGHVLEAHTQIGLSIEILEQAQRAVRLYFRCE